MNSTRPFAKIPGVTYPDPTAPEAQLEPRPKRERREYHWEHSGVVRAVKVTGGNGVATVKLGRVDAPEAKAEKKPLIVLVPRRVARHTESINGRNVSTIWLRQNGLCIRVVDGVRTVVPR